MTVAVAEPARCRARAHARPSAARQPLRERPKPAVHPPGDRFECEADRVARLLASGASAAAAGASAGGSPGDGAPLPPPLRSYFEPRLGRDLGATARPSGRRRVFGF